MNTGDEIKTRRKELGLTQVELAEIAGVTKNTICSYEANRYANIKVAETILKAMGCDLIVVKRRKAKC